MSAETTGVWQEVNKKSADALVVLLLLPLPRQEFDDVLGAGEELVTIAPDGVGSVGFGDAFGVSIISGEADVSLWWSWQCCEIAEISMAYWVFHRSCATLTFFCAVSAVKGGARDIA
jgi:hypothetical protein